MKKINELLVYVSIFLVPFYVFRFKIEDFRTNLFEISIFITFVIFVFQQVVIAIRQPAEKQPILIDRYEPTNHIISRDDKSGVKGFKFGGFVPLIFLIIVLISAVQSDNLITGLGILKGWFVVPIMLYLVIINTFDRKNIYKLAWPVFFSMILVSLWAIFQKLGLVTTLFYQSGDASFAQYFVQNRFFGPFESPNFLAMFIAPVLFLSLPVLWSPSFGLRSSLKAGLRENGALASGCDNTLMRGLHLLTIFLFLIPIYALYITGSRGGLAAFGSSALVFVVLMFLPAITRYASALSIVKIIGLVAVNIVYFYYFIQVKFPEAAASDKIRQEIYEYATKMLKDNWLFSIGLGNFQARVQVLSAVDYSFINFGLPFALHPHNLLLAVWLNLGLAGIIVFLFIIFSFLKQVIASTPSIVRASAGAAMTAILIHGLFDTTYFKNDLSAIFWIIVAFGLAIKRHETYGTK